MNIATSGLIYRMNNVVAKAKRDGYTVEDMNDYLDGSVMQDAPAWVWYAVYAAYQYADSVYDETPAAEVSDY